MENYILLGIGVILLVANLLVQLWKKYPDNRSTLQDLGEAVKTQGNVLDKSLRHEISTNRRELSQQARDSRLELSATLNKFGDQQMQIFNTINKQVSHLMDSNETRFSRLQEQTVGSLDKVRVEVDKRLQAIQADNQLHMDKIRETVGEKLDKTLEDRLGRSFKLVSDHLEKVQKGLGEMRHLAAGVGDLKKVLANVKTRGILGEMQLLNIIEEIMTKDQYSLNARTVPGRECRVEVAIKMPGHKKDDGQVFLPIDSKFPMDKYQQLLEAYDEACKDKILMRTKELNRALLVSAKDIKTKYVSPPYTTDFAIMFLPVEGLYAEISRQPDLIYRLKNEYQILVAGPSNLSAFLSSLQMGFRTIAIEKRSSEVWSLLAEIKTEFGKFGSALEKVQKKLSEANNVIDQAGVRSRAIERRLNKVEELPVSEKVQDEMIQK